MPAGLGLHQPARRDRAATELRGGTPAHIRPAATGDASAIARVHVDSWKTTYAGILPQASLEDLGYRGREQMWKGLDPDSTFVAEAEEGIVGFVSFGPERTADATHPGEIYSLYLLLEWQGRGLGRRLFELGRQGLRRRGLDSMLLWVLRGNPARGFYDRMGGVYLRSQPITIFGLEVEEDALGWAEIGERPRQLDR